MDEQPKLRWKIEKNSSYHEKFNVILEEIANPCSAYYNPVEGMKKVIYCYKNVGFWNKSVRKTRPDIHAEITEAKDSLMRDYVLMRSLETKITDIPYSETESATL